MTEQMTKETETYKTKQVSNIVQRIIYTNFGVISAVLAFRLIFKLLGANSENVFVRAASMLSHSLLWVSECFFILGGAHFSGNR